MEKIKRKSIKFNKRIYKQNAILKAIASYASFGQFKLKTLGGYFVVTIEPVEPGEVSLVLDEFSNYCLGESRR